MYCGYGATVTLVGKTLQLHKAHTPMYKNIKFEGPRTRVHGLTKS